MSPVGRKLVTDVQGTELYVTPEALRTQTGRRRCLVQRKPHIQSRRTVTFPATKAPTAFPVPGTQGEDTGRGWYLSFQLAA